MSSRDDRVARVARALDGHGLSGRIVRLDRDTSTAALAARALGCEVRQIVKSLVFVGADGAPLLALVGGASRVDPGKLAAAAGGPVAKASAGQVLEATGFGIGGVPPVGHADGLAVFMDRGLMGEEEVWSAAGSAHAVFPSTPAGLLEITGARLADLSPGP